MQWWWDRHYDCWLLGIGIQRMNNAQHSWSLCLWIGPYVHGIYWGDPVHWVEAVKAYEKEKGGK
ncbi:MAG TPA: hypothetical protein VNV63_06205 [Nitrospiria bacterium]|jgi:hypothetical protein|nr:hypothetical protein [Nitrospiria bacterium]